MKELILNQTPVRTSENYLINNILLNDIISNEHTKFENINYIDFDENIEITQDTSIIDLSYGNGEETEENVKKNSNVKLRIELKKSSEKENIINFVFDEKNTQLIDDIEIICSENVSGKLTIKYSSKSNLSKVHNGIIRTNLKINSNLKLTIINLLDLNTNNLIAMESILEKNSKLEYNIVDFGGKSSVTNYYSNLIGEYSENILNTAYIGTNNQVLDLNYIVDTKGKNTKIDMDVQGAIKDEAKKHFKGTINFKRGCKKAVGNENEFCMLLSDRAKSISLPMLICDEEDIVGNHATAAGKVDNKELFYIMSRGLTEEEAKTLLVKAKFNRVVNRITNDELKNEILSEIEKRLGR